MVSEEACEGVAVCGDGNMEDVISQDDSLKTVYQS